MCVRRVVYVCRSATSGVGFAVVLKRGGFFVGWAGRIPVIALSFFVLPLFSTSVPAHTQGRKV